MGHSAGAHMGALLCLDPAYLGVQNIAKISHFVGLAGPYSANLTRIDTTAPIFSHATDIDRTRPVKLVANAPEFPRFLLLHGQRDRTVGEQNTVNLAAALAENGAQVQAKSYAKLGHLGIFLTMNPGLRWISPVWRDVMRFLKDPS
jgi:acetyl esterase/lipase